MMRTPWNSPLINTLTTDDAARLQQIFMSLSFELSEMRKEMEELRKSIDKMNRNSYGVRP
jgi:hypothetical protein